MAKSLLYLKLASLSAAVKVANGLSTISGFSITAAGTGYAVGDTLTVSGGTASTTATLLVMKVGANGAIITLGIITPGTYTSKPSNSVSTTTTGAGSGATLLLTWMDNMVPNGTSYALVVPETQNVRWCADGTAPTASEGMLLVVGTALVYDGTDLASLQFIQVASSATLFVTFFG